MSGTPVALTVKEAGLDEAEVLVDDDVSEVGGGPTEEVTLQGGLRGMSVCSEGRRVCGVRSGAPGACGSVTQPLLQSQDR